MVKTLPEYRASCKLGEIFKPGCTSGPEDESSEKDVYKMLELKGGFVKNVP